MLFDAKVNNKSKRNVALVAGCILIVIFWYMEKIKRVPQYGRVFYELGMSCKDTCGRQKRLQYFQKAVYYDPNLIDGYYQSALIYEAMGAPAKAFEYFKKVTELDYQNIFAFYRVGLHFFKEGAYELALRYLVMVDNKKGAPDRLHYYLARAYDQTGKYRLAAAHYRKIIWVRPEYAAEVYPRLAEISVILDDKHIAEEELFWLREFSKHDLADQLQRAVNEAWASR